MPLPAALPFQMRRSHDVYGVAEITSTTERIHGLLRLEREHLVVQWRIARQTERVGSEIRTDHEVEAVQEVVLPLNALGGSVVQRVRWPWPWTPRLVLRASDLRASRRSPARRVCGSIIRRRSCWGFSVVSRWRRSSFLRS